MSDKDEKLRAGQIEHFTGFEKAEEKSEKNILKIYTKKLIELKNYTSYLFENYEEDGKLSYDEILKYGRLGKMGETLKGITIALYAENASEIAGTLDSSYKTGYNGTSELLSGFFGKKSLISVIKEEELHRAATSEISGLKWTDRLEVDRAQAVAKIRETLVRGLHDGETYSQMAKRLDDTLGKDVVNPLRIVRTESHRVFAQAKKDRLDKVNNDGMTKEWVTSGDEVVRSNHRPMNEVKVPYKDDFTLPNGNRGFGPCMIGKPEDDINCRCFWVVGFEG